MNVGQARCSIVKVKFHRLKLAKFIDVANLSDVAVTIRSPLVSL